MTFRCQWAVGTTSTARDFPTEAEADRFAISLAVQGWHRVVVFEVADQEASA